IAHALIHVIGALSSTLFRAFRSSSFSCASSFLFIIPRPPTSTLFPYTTLFRSHRHLLLFELPDLFDSEAARDDDLHVLEPFPVERPAHVPDELRIDARRLEGAHLRNHRLVDERLRRVDPHAVEPLAQRARQDRKSV